MTRLRVATAGLLLLGCSPRAWMSDESGRIDEVMRPAPGERPPEGIAFEGGPPLAKPFPQGRPYSVSSPRTERRTAKSASRRPRTRGRSRASRGPAGD